MMKTGLWLVLAAVIAPLVKDRPFKQQKVSEERFEAVGVFDVNGDKVPDLVSGEWWYEGPSFKKKFFIGKVRAEGEYYDDFSTIPMDVNGDGRMDFVTGGWFGGTLIWKENTGKLGAEWPEHVIDACGNVETTRAWDVDGDGTPEIVPNNPGRPFKMYRLNKDGSFTKYQLLEKQGHGLGFGDANGDGRGDFILADGWLEAPEKPFAQKWVFHEDFKLGQASVPILVTDVDKDGKNDLIVGAAHDYGLFWYKQSDVNGQRTWEKKLIDDKNSQYHEMHWRDITGDGKPELVTGKRYRAHNDNDAGAKDDYGMFYFTWNGSGFDKHTIVFGPAGKSKGTGIAMEIVDLNGDKLPEIVAAGKDGLSVFWNGK